MSVTVSTKVWSEVWCFDKILTYLIIIHQPHGNCQWCNDTNRHILYFAGNVKQTFLTQIPSCQLLIQND